MKHFLTHFLSILLLASCENEEKFSEEINKLTLKLAPLKLKLRDTTGFTQEIESRNKNLNRDLMEFLCSKHRKWRHERFTNYAADVIFYHDGLTINVMNNGIAVNLMCDDGVVRQYSTNSTPEDKKELLMIYWGTFNDYPK